MPHLYLIILIIVQCSLSARSVRVDTLFKNGSDFDEDVHFYIQEPLKVVEEDNVNIPWSSNVEGVKNVSVFVDDEFVSVISNHQEIFHSLFSKAEEYEFVNASSSETVTVEGLINMTAKFIGFNKIRVILYGEQNEILGNGTLKVGVTLKAKALPEIFEKCLAVILVIVYINMGANIDLEVVKKIVKLPIGPLIGLLSQYVCMPMLSYGFGLVFFPNNPLFRLGLFTSGCAPGGGLSNMWTHLLGGSLDLSIMMTFSSTAFALGTIPLWLLTMGRVIVNEANFVIPYLNVIYAILIMVLPSILGVIVQLKCERVTKLMKILLTPLSVANILFICSFGVYANVYLFSYMTWRAVLAGFSQTISGLLIGYFIAFLCRRNQKERIAIGIETAVQNNNIAFLILKMSLGKPEGDLAVLLPGCVALFTPLPFFVLLFIKIMYEKLSAQTYKKNKSNELEDVPKVVEENGKIENIDKRDNNKIDKQEKEKGIYNTAFESTHL